MFRRHRRARTDRTGHNSATRRAGDSETRNASKPETEPQALAWGQPAAKRELHPCAHPGYASGARSWIETALAELPCKQTPLTHAVALATLEVELPHRDPADRWLAATARVFGLKLVTADRQLLAGRGYETVRAA